MRHLRAYTWDKVLEENYITTMVGLEFINKERREEKKAMDKAKRKR